MNRITSKPVYWMARKVKSLAEAKPKITNLYDSFIDFGKDSQIEETTSSFKEEFLNENPAVKREGTHIVEYDDTNDAERQRFITTELLSDQFKPNMKTHTQKVLKKLDKDVRWGLAGELIKQQNKGFARDRLPTTDEIREFLMREMFKDIKIFDLIELKKSQLADIGIIATGYSHRHVYKSAKTLSKEMEKLEEGILKNLPRVHGRKDDEWVMICIGTKYIIHLMTENAREDAAMEDKWLDQEIWNQPVLGKEEIKRKIREYENPFKFKNLNK